MKCITINTKSLSKSDRDRLTAEIIYRFYNNKLNGIDDISKAMKVSRDFVSTTINEYLKPKSPHKFIILPSKLNND